MAGHKDAFEMLRANIEDLAWILSQARASARLYSIESFVYLSSSSVTLPVQTPYSRTKRAAEEMIQALPIPHCIVRPFSVTGVGEQKAHLIPTLISSCFEGTEVKFVPGPTHDYVDVEDVVNGLITLADNKAIGIFEFGTGIATSNQQVLEIVEKMTGKKANIRAVESLRSYDNANWYSTNLRSARAHGFRITKTLEDSIKEMVEDYETKRRIISSAR